MKPKNSRGSILILTLWILAVLVLLSLGLGYLMSLDQRLVAYQRDRLMALYLAKAGVQRVVAELEQHPTSEMDASVNPWFHNPDIFREVALGQGSYTLRARIPRGDDEPEKGFEGILDEDQRINLNTASREVLLRLPRMTDEIADSILDWRDEDPFSHFAGAEDFYYGGLEPPYKAKNAPFEVLEELLLVRGVTEEIFEAVEPFVTIYTDGKVNLNTAPREVLTALGMSPGLVTKVLRFRSGMDGLGLTADDQGFTSLGSAEQQLNAVEPLVPQEAAEMTNLITQNLLKVDSQVFRIAAQGKVRQGKITRSVEAIVKRAMKTPTGRPAPTVLLSWREG